ncbi:hypothetical protein N658DRAFT_496283 [Parathielavia hyrcaniae]|uniref:Uncharacterized protein n=1 Tax=Parathielavia hyrcaniae TaxID=113614 RepID=A0AAN6Q0M8_9PEZI|nr:hypothetical protein N658DRAFT_496283 [Parathielavia hyrcaniae]
MGSHDYGGDDERGQPRGQAAGLKVEGFGHDGDDVDVGDEEEGDDDDDDDDDEWDNDTNPSEGDLDRCALCDRLIPRFAFSAHERYHGMGDS